MHSAGAYSYRCWRQPASHRSEEEDRKLSVIGGWTGRPDLPSGRLPIALTHA